MISRTSLHTVILLRHTAIAWVKAALGDDGVSDQESAVAAQIAVLQTPVSGTGVPWAA
jgi:hypothetical protein